MSFERVGAVAAGLSDNDTQSTSSETAAQATASSTTPSLKDAVPPERLTAPANDTSDSAALNRRSSFNVDNDAPGKAEKQTTDNTALDYPDGGLRAWLFGPFQSYYQGNQLSSFTESDISWIGSFQLASVLWFAILAGRAFDAGYVKWLLAAGVVIYAAGLFGLAFANSYWQIFLAQAVAPGIASGIIFTPAVSSVSHWFRKRRAFALGILSTGSSVGGVVYPLVLNNMFQSTSYRNTVLTCASLTTALLVFAALAVNSRLPPRTKGAMVDFRHFKDIEFILFVIGESLIMLGLYLPYYFIQAYSLSNGVDENVAFYSLSILNAASLFGRIIPNWLADHYGPFTILIPNCFASGILIFAWIGMCKTTAGTVMFCLLFGFASGAYVSMMPACIASMTTEMNQIGIRIAMAFLFVSPFALTGTPIAGAIVSSSNGSYVGAACFSGAVCIIGSLVNVGTHIALQKRKGTFWV
ncbi:hypothetical protein OIV83_005262 [Microbotryomycetes sp. JL201]|nr:hypothetical protein OIV83_005262 [Microbotryomycetes sp. JL201]